MDSLRCMSARVWVTFRMSNVAKSWTPELTMRISSTEVGLTGVWSGSFHTRSEQPERKNTAMMNCMRMSNNRLRSGMDPQFNRHDHPMPALEIQIVYALYRSRPEPLQLRISQAAGAQRPVIQNNHNGGHMLKSIRAAINLFLFHATSPGSGAQECS